LTEDGADKRVEMVGRTITRPEHGEEVLRIAGLLAHASAGVSDVERSWLEKLATRFGLEAGVLERVLDEVEAAVGSD
jgi:tellurite resistance protein